MFEGLDLNQLSKIIFDENPNVSFSPSKIVDDGKENAFKLLCQKHKGELESRKSSETIDPWDDRTYRWNDPWDSLNYKHERRTK